MTTTKGERGKKALSLSSIKQRRRLPRASPSEPRSGPSMPTRPRRNEEFSFFFPEAAARGATKSREEAPGAPINERRVKSVDLFAIAHRRGGRGLSRRRQHQRLRLASSHRIFLRSRERMLGSARAWDFPSQKKSASEPRGSQKRGGDPSRAGGSGGRRRASKNAPLVIGRLSPRRFRRLLALPRRCANKSLSCFESKRERAQTDLPCLALLARNTSLEKKTKSEPLPFVFFVFACSFASFHKSTFLLFAEASFASLVSVSVSRGVARSSLRSPRLVPPSRACA